jgi:membrane fusion protein (multidrug efflux system)
LSALLFALPACQAGEDAKASAGHGSAAFTVDSAVLVEVVEAQQGVPFVVKGDYAGEFAADRAAEVAFEVPGRIVTLDYDIGDRLKKGEVLAEIDQTTYRQQVREASAAVQMAEAGVGQAKVAVEDLEANLRRKRPLLEKQLISARAIEDLDAQLRQAKQKVLVAQASLDQSRARLQTARENLRNTKVRAPFDAQIAARLVGLGSYVGPNQPVFRLVSDKGIYLRINVPEQDAASIAVDTPVTVRIGALGGGVFKARVVRVAPAIDPATRTLRADIELEPTAEQKELIKRVRPGMYAQVQVQLGRRDDAVTVPRQVVLEGRGGARYVWVVADGKAHKRSLILGLQGRERVEVLQGLQGGESVVLRGFEKLKEGSEVRLLNPPENQKAETEKANTEKAGTEKASKEKAGANR